MQGFVGNLFQPYALNHTMGASKVFPHKFIGQSHGIEDLRPTVGLICGDPHLGHHLENTLAHGLDVTLVRLLNTELPVDLGGKLVHHGRDRVKGQIGINGLRTVACKATEIVHLTCLAGLHYQTHRGAQTFADQVMMYRCGSQ